MGRAILFIVAVLIATPIWLFNRITPSSSTKPDFEDVIDDVMERFAVVLQSLEDRWEVATQSAREGGRRGRASDIHQQFSIFLAFIGALPNQGAGVMDLTTEEKKRRYFYFVLGAAHCLAENSPDKDEAGKFFRAVANDTSTRLFGKNEGEQEFLQFLQNAASEIPTEEYFDPVTENGYSAMKNYLHGIEGLRPDTVAHIIRQHFRDSIVGPEMRETGNHPEN